MSVMVRVNVSWVLSRPTRYRALPQPNVSLEFDREGTARIKSVPAAGGGLCYTGPS
jgi:hypothetical protein